jgi:antitoxin component HigA of HigAB toxin-antitoxin module
MVALLKTPRKKDAYLELILHVHPLRPVENSREHEQAKRALRSLAGDKRPVALKFKKVLAGIIQAYEREAGWKMDTSAVSPAQIVRHLLSEHGKSVNAFANERGISQSALSDMLNGKRDWSKSAIVAVADYFGLNRGMFLR